MPADDREAKFERALAHHLRGDSAAACPDAETLAAYHERSLSLDEMGHWKQHIAGCAACQETLALVEATEKNLTEDWEEKRIPVLEGPAQRPVSLRSIAGRSIEAAGEEALGEEASTAVAAPIQISRRRRPPLLRWAIPLGAVAAGVLVWIGIHEQGALKRQAESVQLARNQNPSPPAQMAQNQPAPKPEQKLNDTLQSAQTPMDRNDRQGQLAEKGIRERAESSDAESRQASPSLRMAKPIGGAKDAELAKKETDGRIAGALAYDAAPTPPPPPAHAQAPPKVPASATESVEVSAAAPSVAPEPAPVVTGGAVGGGAGAVTGGPTREIDSKSASNAARQKAPAKQKAAEDLDTSTSAMMMKQGINGRDVTSLNALVFVPAVILTPDNKVWWKVDPAGTLELTTDGGKTWKPLNTGANAQLTMGSAPSSRVCWIAGKAGTLVLTTDRGAHWKVVPTPITRDLGGVRATDAKHAFIWDAARQQSFETSDGGATWKQTAP